MMKVKDLEKERLSWIMQVSPQKDPYKRKAGIPDTDKETDVITAHRWKKGFPTKECRQPLEAGRGRVMDPFLEPPEGTQPH